MDCQQKYSQRTIKNENKFCVAKVSNQAVIFQELDSSRVNFDPQKWGPCPYWHNKEEYQDITRGYGHWRDSFSNPWLHYLFDLIHGGHNDHCQARNIT